MRVLISGATGMIGTALRRELLASGHEVVVLSRTPTDSSQAKWDLDSGFIEAEKLHGVDGAVHLAGEGIGDHRWTTAHKARVLDSRVRGTRLISETLAGLSPAPSVMVSASGINYYGDRGDEVLTEESEPGTDFLSEVCQQWESSTAPAATAGIRVIRIRSGIVLSKRGGALPPLLLPAKIGAGGRLGSGRQFWSWISLEDELRAIQHMLETPDIRGAVNLTAPNPVRNRDFARALGRALHRPSVIPAPAFALRMIVGEMAEPLILASQRVVPQRLATLGFTFRHETVEEGLRAALA